MISVTSSQSSSNSVLPVGVVTTQAKRKKLVWEQGLFSHALIRHFQEKGTDTKSFLLLARCLALGKFHFNSFI